MAASLKETLLQLGILGLETSASGRPTRILVYGFARDAAHLQRIDEALAAHAEVVNDVVPIASKTSGPFPSSLDGSPAASPARLKVRSLLDHAAVLRAENEYADALTLVQQAVAVCDDVDEPTLAALARYAAGYLLFEGRMFLEPTTPPAQHFEAAAACLEGHEADDRILTRNLERMLTRSAKR